MKLITHNILLCAKKGCTKNNFPLRLNITKTSLAEEGEASEFSPVLMSRLIEKLDWVAFRSTVASLGWDPESALPEEAPSAEQQQNELLM